MNVDGKCHCGQIRFRAEVDPEKVSICHCTDCQTMSGSAYRVSAHVAIPSFELLAGKIKAYVKTAESGNKRVQAFCPECGTHLYAESLVSPAFRSLRVGNLTQRASLPPRRQIWCRSAMKWSENLSAITPKFDTDGVW